MIVCKNCNLEFSSTVIIDGKRRNLSTRKYCLTCSPFGAHNTRDPKTILTRIDPNDPTRKKSRSERKIVAECKGCNKEKKLRSKESLCGSCVTKNKRLKVKLKAMEYKGNSCEKCGYDKCKTSLSFHHLDPKQKDFTISYKAYRYSWSKVKEELDKTILLCANCHAEEHARLEIELNKNKANKPRAVIKWRNATKQRMIESMGSKCQICSYNICTRSMDFHHLDPKEKDFNFNKARANLFGWDSLSKELKKCILLCSNCHREVHENLAKIPETFATFIDIYNINKNIAKEVHKRTTTDKCPICNNDKSIKIKTCSDKCSRKSREKIDWDSIDLETLIQQKSVVQIGKQLGVSDVAVHKRLKKMRLK